MRIREFCQRRLELHAIDMRAIRARCFTDTRCRDFADHHLIALWHRARRNLKGQTDILGLHQGDLFCRRRCSQQDAGRRDILTFHLDRFLLTVEREANGHAVVDEITLPVLVVLLQFDITRTRPSISRVPPATVPIRAMSCHIRRIREQPPVWLQAKEHIVFNGRFLLVIGHRLHLPAPFLLYPCSVRQQP